MKRGGVNIRRRRRKKQEFQCISTEVRNIFLKNPKKTRSDKCMKVKTQSGTEELKSNLRFNKTREFKAILLESVFTGILGSFYLESLEFKAGT